MIVVLKQVGFLQALPALGTQLETVHCMQMPAVCGCYRSATTRQHLPSLPIYTPLHPSGPCSPLCSHPLDPLQCRRQPPSASIHVQISSLSHPPLCSHLLGPHQALPPRGAGPAAAARAASEPR